jgi:cyclic pyranopterin phosphate synthase
VKTRPVDLLRRPLRDLRVSVTDRCNFRCAYCMPRELFGPDHVFLPREQLLTFEEITRVVGVFARLGVRKVRLTGGEPLLRHGIADLVSMVAGVEGIDDVALTTNGALLAPVAAKLRAAGLRRVTVSLDSVDPDVFAAMADTRVPLQQVLDGIAAAVEAGFAPVKINAVVKRGVNDDGVLPLVAYAREAGLVVRFIEYMDVGTTNGWRMDDVVPAAELLATVAAAYPVEPVDPAYRGEVARRYRFVDGRGEVGFITSVTQPFCDACTRARLTAVGELYTCLFGSARRDLRDVLRSGASDDELADAIAGVWVARDDRYSELRTAESATLPKAEMSYLGG